MHVTMSKAALGAMVGLAAAAGAQAAPIAISGTISRSNPGALPGERCAPALTVINNNLGSNYALGTSNLGAFTVDASACIRFPVPTRTFDGVWTWTFARGTLFGTTFSDVTPTATPGILAIEGVYTITGGTGYFGGATGTITERGTLDRSALPIAVAVGDFTGLVDVPEPAAAGVLGLGGLALLRRRRRG